MASVYIETSIPSFYFDTRRNVQFRAWREVTRRWWETVRHRYALCSSPFVVAELERTPEPKRTLALGLLEGIRLLADSQAVRTTALVYVKERLMPADALGDAAHLASASVHRIDFLLTWNCRHLANANKFGHIAAVNRRLGLSTPALVTPLGLLGEADL